jgi:hypothetical protein
MKTEKQEQTQEMDAYDPNNPQLHRYNRKTQ